jgi:hypothetical protein
MGTASTLLAELTAKAATRETTPEEREHDLLALPTGQLVPLFPRPTDRKARVVAQAPEQVWD